MFQGSESGGHGAAIGNGSIFSTLPEVVDEIGDRVPVLAAGGVTDGRQLAAALNLGASGVVMGTRFVACVESDAPLAHKKALVEARDGG